MVLTCIAIVESYSSLQHNTVIHASLVSWSSHLYLNVIRQHAPLQRPAFIAVLPGDLPRLPLRAVGQLHRETAHADAHILTALLRVPPERLNKVQCELRCQISV